MASTQPIKKYLYGFLLSTISFIAFSHCYVVASLHKGLAATPHVTLSEATIGDKQLSTVAATPKKATLAGLDYGEAPLSGLANLLLIFLLLVSAISLRKLWDFQTLPLPLQQDKHTKEKELQREKSIPLADIKAKELDKIAIKVVSASNEKTTPHAPTSYLLLDSNAAQTPPESPLSIQK